jgi:bifunctional non-homologous end joining protein LigD
VPPADLLYADEPPDRRIVWVRPELVAEVQFANWTRAGRVHRPSISVCARTNPREVVREPPGPEVPRQTLHSAACTRIVHAPAPAKEGRTTKGKDSRVEPAAAPVVRARRGEEHETLEGIALSHPDKELWPGITKRDLAEYWLAVAPHALPGIAQRPLAVVRCPDGIAGQHFFQKHHQPGFPEAIRGGEAGGQPYLALDDAAGLVAAAQAGAIELHAWGAREADPLHPDRLVFDLDPGEGVAFAEVIKAAREVCARLAELGLTAFCRTTGGKGLHVVAPLTPRADWNAVREWCRRFAQAMEAEAPSRYVASVPKRKRVGHILVDWLRNGIGATAIASFSPRARPGATVATPLDWREVKPGLDPASFTLRTIPERLRRRRRDPWAGFAEAARPLPEQEEA